MTLWGCEPFPAIPGCDDRDNPCSAGEYCAASGLCVIGDDIDADRTNGELPQSDAAPRAPDSGPQPDASPLDAALQADASCKDTELFCNGVDDDCDGRTDEGFPDKGDSCAGRQFTCNYRGTWQCDAAGARVCQPIDPFPAEICDGIDNDCDGAIDNDIPEVGAGCLTGQGICETPGVSSCTAGALICNPAQEIRPEVERCDGLDNNCDGEVDEGFGVAQECQIGVGACTRDGTTACTADELDVECAVLPGQPVEEICNGIDDNCDGSTDETFLTLGDACETGVGACRSGGLIVCDANGGTTCGAPVIEPALEICNGVDDNCDGTTDEGYEAVGQGCSAGLGECERAGFMACTAEGGLDCDAELVAAELEICDALDNDCDGQTDEAFPDLGDVCRVEVGLCQSEGVRACADDGTVMCEAPPPNISDEICDGVDNDCDGTADEDFAADLGQECLLQNFEQTCGALGLVECGPDGQLSCDADFGVLAEEVCDGFDNNCNGATDEGFDLLSDTANCGGCGQICGPFPNATAACGGGTCFIERCDNFWYDEQPEQPGCETLRQGRFLIVRQGADPAGADGTVDRPFPTIVAGLAAAVAGDIISVGAGVFDGDLDARVDYVTIRGTDRLTTISGSVTIRGSFTRLQGVTVNAQNSSVGVALECDEGCAVLDSEITNVGLADGAASEPVFGIRVSQGVRHVIHNNRISRVFAGTVIPTIDDCGDGPHGFSGSGIQLDSGAQQSQITNNVISQIRGGKGADAEVLECQFVGGLGGEARGINLTDAAGFYVVANNRIDQIQGGAGGQGAAFANGGMGGRGAGLRIAGANNIARGNTISNVSGGAGGGGGPNGNAGPPGHGFGVYFQPILPDQGALPPDETALFSRDQPSLQNEIAPSNTLDGRPIIFAFEHPNLLIEGLDLGGPSAATNLGAIVLVDCDDAIVRGNTISGVRGGLGKALVEPDELSPGAMMAGITVFDSTRAIIENNSISEITGGHGGETQVNRFSAFVTSGSSGGAAAGIRLWRVTGSLVRDNTLAQIQGGDGGNGAPDGGSSGRGGRAAGIDLLGSNGNTLANNTMRQISGGPGGTPGTPNIFVLTASPSGHEGTGFGIYMNTDTDVAVGSVENRIDALNTIEGEPIFHLFNEPGRVVENQRLDQPVQPTNLGKISVVASPGAIIRDNVIANYRGEAGETSAIGGPGTFGSDAMGILIGSSPDMVISGNRISDMTGGPGGPGGASMPGFNGGRAAGIAMLFADGVLIENNRIAAITAGPGGRGGPSLGGVPALGGDGLAGNADGIQVRTSRNARIRQTLIHGISSGYSATGIRVGFTPDAPTFINNVTIDSIFGDLDGVEPDIDTPSPTGVGVHLDTNLSVSIEDSILSNISHHAVLAQSVSSTFVRFTDIFAPGISAFNGDIATSNTLNLDPLFEGDYRLRFDSPCIDAGNPLANCDAEPAAADGTCRIDLGHRGGTALADTL